MERVFNNHVRKEKSTYSFLVTEVLELDGVSGQTHLLNKPTNRIFEKWMLFMKTGGICQKFWPRLIQTHCVGVQGVEEDDGKVKQDFKILNLLSFSILFGNIIFSFHSHPLFIVPFFQVFLKGLGDLHRN